MRRLPVLVLGLLNLASVIVSAADPPDPRLLSGVWEGTMTRVQAGRCSIDGEKKTVQNVRLVIHVDEKDTVRAGLAILPDTRESPDNVKIRVDKDRLFLDIPATASCGQNFTRKYAIKHEIGAALEPDGRRMLRLAGMDVPCIQSGCRFQSLIEVEFKADAPTRPPR